MGSLLSPDLPKRATVSVAGFFPFRVLELPVPRCAGSRLPAVSAVTAAARPWARPAGSCLPETCPAVCACVCLSESLPLHHSGAREGPGLRRPAAESLPVHTLPALSPPTPPLLLLALSLLSLLLLLLPLPSSQRQWRNRSEKGGEGWGRKRRCLQPRGGRTPWSGSLPGEGRLLGGEKLAEDLPGGGGPAAEHRGSHPGAGASCAVGRRGGRPGLFGRLRSLLGEPVEVTSVRARAHTSRRDSISDRRDSISEELKPVSLMSEGPRPGAWGTQVSRELVCVSSIPSGRA